MNETPLLQLIAPEVSTAFCYGKKGDRNYQDFLNDIAYFGSNLGNQKRYGLFSQDSYFFAVAFFALLHKNKTIVLPNNPQKERLASLDEQVDIWLRDDLDSFNFIDIETEKSKAIQLNYHVGEIELWTSGSTGQPKSITKNLSQLICEVEMLQQHFPVSCNKIYSTVPHFHIYGLLFKILWPVLTQRSFNRETSFTLEDFLAKAKQQEHYLLVSCPAHLKRLPDALSTQSLNVHFEKIFSSGGACDSVTCKWWFEHMQTITEIFGSTETGGVAYREGGHLSQSWTSLPKVNLKVDEEVLMVHSPFTGTDLWVSMGDHVELSDDLQSFIFKGRGDRIAKVQEKRVSLIEMEQLLMDHPDVSDSFVFMPDGPTSAKPRLCAAITIETASLPKYYQKGHRTFTKTLEEYLSSWFEPMTVPKSWRLCQEIPYNPTGKRTADACQYLWKDDFKSTKTLPYILNSNRQSYEELILDLECPYHLIYFKGHFPNNPILAGVVQIHWVKIFIKIYFKIKINIVKIIRLKYNSTILPGDRIKLKLKYNTKKLSISFCFYNNSKTFSSGTLFFISRKAL